MNHRFGKSELFVPSFIFNDSQIPQQLIELGFHLFDPQGKLKPRRIPPKKENPGFEHIDGRRTVFFPWHPLERRFSSGTENMGESSHPVP